MTLDELKEQNAAEDTETQQSQVVEDVEDEAAEELHDETEDADAKAETDSEGEDSEIPDWMKEDDQTSENGQGVPVAKHVAIKQKLKGKLKDANSEVEQLRAEIEQLKQGGTQPAPPPRASLKQVAMPKLEDFEYDEGRYAEAVSNWHQERINSTLDDRLNQHNQTSQRQAAQTEQARVIDQHYERAAHLIADTGLDADDYRNADTVVRQALQEVTGKGDQIADSLIANLSSLGKGSEKVWLNLGRSKTNLAKLQETLKQDPSGLRTMAYLGSLQSKFESAANRVSKAPKPGTKLKGDTKAVESADGLRRKYLAAHKSGDASKAFNIRQQARAAGADPTKW